MVLKFSGNRPHSKWLPKWTLNILIFDKQNFVVVTLISLIFSRVAETKIVPYFDLKMSSSFAFNQLKLILKGNIIIKQEKIKFLKVGTRHNCLVPGSISGENSQYSIKLVQKCKGFVLSQQVEFELNQNRAIVFTLKSKN